MTVHDDRKLLIAELVGDLVRLRSSAGQPPFTKITRYSEKWQAAQVPLFGVRVTRLPRSTVHDLLRRDRTQPPRAELAESLWAVLRRIALDEGRRPAGLASLDELRGRLRAIHLLARLGARASGDAGLPEVLDPFGRPPPDGDEDAARQWLLESAALTKGQAWWYAGRHLLPEWLQTYLTLERRADEVRAYSPRFVPGMLQTEEYAWAAIRRDRPGATAAELAGLVHLRMRRQEPLWRRDALRFWAIIDESVLRAGTCGPAAMRTQLDHLIKLAGQRHVTIQVMPCAAAGHDSADGPVTLVRFPERPFPDVVLIEQHDHGLYPTKSGDVGHYRTVLARLAIEAMPPEESLPFLRDLRDGPSIDL